MIDNEGIYKSNVKKDFLEKYHQQAAKVNDPDQNVEILFGENNIYHQIGNACLQNEIRIEKDVANAADRVFVVGDVIRLLNIAFGYCFKEARLSTIKSSVIELNKDVGQISTVMRALTSKDGNILSHIDKIDEPQAEIHNTSLKHTLVNNNDVGANKGKSKGLLPLEHAFGFCRTFKNII